MRLGRLPLLLCLGVFPAMGQGPQRVAVPAYFYPDCTVATPCLFDQLAAGAPTVGLAVVNPASGPGKKKDASYAAEVKRLQSRGIAVLGYVATGYGKVRASSAQQQVDKYYSWYGVDGIFFDEASNSCSRLSYYQGLNAHVKGKPGSALTVLNPGTNTPECYASAADVLLTFEDTYQSYLSWEPSGWEQAYPASRFWHLVIGTPEAQLPAAVARSKANHAGWLYVTPDNLPNPWDTLPPAGYWSTELSLASAASE